MVEEWDDSDTFDDFDGEDGDSSTAEPMAPPDKGEVRFYWVSFVIVLNILISLYYIWVWIVWPKLQSSYGVNRRVSNLLFPKQKIKKQI